MKIYLDYIFLENLVINIVIISEIVVFTKTKITSKRKAFVVVLDTILSTLFVVNKTNIIIKILIQNIILYILFKGKKVGIYIKKALCYYLLYFLYLGLIISLTIIINLNLNYEVNKIIIYIISGIFFHFFSKDLWKVWKIKLTDRDICYFLDINGYKVKAFVDTGNRVKDLETSLDVIFILDNLKDKILTGNEKKINIDINTVNGDSSKEAYIVNNVIVYKEEREITKIDKIIISFSLKESSTPEKYSAIIGYETYLDNLEGVML